MTVRLGSDGLPLDVTIVRSRYSGIYEPGVWLAFAQPPDLLPPEWNGSDTECCGYFALESNCRYLGGGDTPQNAYDDLLSKLGTEAAGS